MSGDAGAGWGEADGGGEGGEGGGGGGGVSGSGEGRLGGKWYLFLARTATVKRVVTLCYHKHTMIWVFISLIYMEQREPVF